MPAFHVNSLISLQVYRLQNKRTIAVPPTSTIAVATEDVAWADAAALKIKQLRRVHKLTQKWFTLDTPKKTEFSILRHVLRRCCPQEFVLFIEKSC